MRENTKKPGTDRESLKIVDWEKWGFSSDFGLLLYFAANFAVFTFSVVALGAYILGWGK